MHDPANLDAILNLVAVCLIGMFALGYFDGVWLAIKDGRVKTS